MIKTGQYTKGKGYGKPKGGKGKGYDKPKGKSFNFSSKSRAKVEANHSVEKTKG